VSVSVHIAPITVEHESTRDDDAEHQRDSAGRVEAETVEPAERPEQK
jgi:hypothetical protein